MSWGETISDEVAGLSGAALGVITMPGYYSGAVAGYKFGKGASQLSRKYFKSNMARKSYSRSPTPRGRPNTRSQLMATPARSRSSRRVSIASSTVADMARLRRASVANAGTQSSRYVKGNINSENSVSTRQAAVKHQRKKNVSIKKPKKVRVSPKFRKQVVKALEPSKFYGKYHEMGAGYYTFPISLGGGQYVFRPGHYSGLDQYLFNPMRVWHAANVLWNSKPESEQAQYTNYIPALQSNYYNLDNFKINVKNSYTTYHIKNNSKRTWILTLYECAPKHNMSHLIEKDVYSQWLDSMSFDQGVPLTATGEIINPTFIRNVNACTPATLGVTPGVTPQLNTKWSFEKHDIILDPGQTYVHYVQGPADTIYDFAKFRKQVSNVASQALENQFCDIQKNKTRQVLIVAKMDLVRNTAAAVRSGIDEADAQNLLIEYKNYFHLECPEQTGGIFDGTAGNKNFSLGKQRTTYCYKNWATGTVAPLVRIDEENVEDTV